MEPEIKTETKKQQFRLTDSGHCWSLARGEYHHEPA